MPSGIYWVMANIRLDGAAGNYFRIAISINGRTPDVNGGMHSVSGLPSASYYTLHVSGAMVLSKGNTVSVWVYSNSDNSFLVNTESTFSVQFLGYTNTIPAFLADLGTSYRYRNTNTFYRPSRWTTRPTGAFVSMGGFNANTGFYTVPVAGIYLVSTNFRLDRADTGYFRVAIAIDGKVDLNNGLSTIKSGSLHKRYHTVNIFGAVPLRKGQTLSVMTQSSTDRDWYVQSETGFSAAYIGPLGQVRGMHARRRYTFSTTRRNTWYELWGWSLEGSALFGDSYFSQVTGRYTTQASGKVIGLSARLSVFLFAEQSICLASHRFIIPS